MMLNKESLKRNSFIVKCRQLSAYLKWKIFKSQSTPHLLKQQILKQYAQDFSLSALVETGTYLGDMVYAMKDKFARIYSIELAHGLFRQAQMRFNRYPHITIIEGNSARVLPDIIGKLTGPTLFWLDGHYSGGETAKTETDTPIVKEVEAIVQQSKNPFVILIDDARLFAGKDGYPTIVGLKDFISQKNPKLKFFEENDIIRITP